MKLGFFHGNCAVLKDLTDMKRVVFIVGLLVLINPLFALPGDVVYTEGESYIRDSSGDEWEADIGDTVDTGDTVTTGYDGFVELDRSGISLKINADTVFTLMEREENREKIDVFSIALGSIKFKYDKITGREPRIQMVSCVAGVRGTELTVFSGVDGSSLIVVDKGLVAVESAGRVVELGPEEGVEVKPGQAPGEKFKFKRDQIDYAQWNEDKLRTLLDDPVEAITNIKGRLDYYIDKVTEYDLLYKEYSAKLTVERKKTSDLIERKGQEEASKYQEEVVYPLIIDTRNIYLNLRYFSLTALSLRRYVAGRIYVTIKSRYIANRSAVEYIDYMEQHSQVLDRFESSIVPQLVEADI